MTWQVIEADCVEAMREMDEASVDAVVTDPPYGLEFMGKEWDRLAGDWRTDLGRGEHAAASGRPSGKRGFDGHPPTPRFHAGKKSQEWHQAWATEALRVLKPGGHLLAFGGTRTYHRLACAIEDAGFEIRDSVIWLYGSGFPKSLDVSKAIDRAAGAEREVSPERMCSCDAYPNRSHPVSLCSGRPVSRPGQVPDGYGEDHVSLPATPEAQRWQGFGTSMKPAHEPVVVARKPLVGTVAETVTRFGTGALNIDGTRISGELQEGRLRHGGGEHSDHIRQLDPDKRNSMPAGRWPANVALSHLSGDEPCQIHGIVHCTICQPRGCVRVGERRVKGIVGGSRGASSNIYGGGKGLTDAQPEVTEMGYADPDGLETVEAWRCQEGCPVAELDRQSGETTSTGGTGASNQPLHMSREAGGVHPVAERANAGGLGDTGGASRFFATFSESDVGGGQSVDSRVPAPIASTADVRFRYVAKASRAERNAGLEGFEERWSPTMNDGIGGLPHTPPGEGVVDGERVADKRNVHPLSTVKPVDLMRWLVRLVTPPGGTCLDCFAGSGTTGIACVLEDFDFIGIEREPDYTAIARSRIAWWDTHKDRADEILALSSKSERERTEHVDRGQMGLFGESPRAEAKGRTAYGDYAKTVTRCPEHGESIPSGSFGTPSYRCGCPVLRKEIP